MSHPRIWLTYKKPHILGNMAPPTPIQKPVTLFFLKPSKLDFPTKISKIRFT